jgi:probable F420-dependent oxidoreductase
MKFWQSVAWAEAEQLTEVAKFAEEVGFHGVINADHLFIPRTTSSVYLYSEDGKMMHEPDTPYPEVWSSFGAMAAVTTRLRFTTSVYLLALRSPLEIAKATGTLARISDNRISIGFGVGWIKEEFDAMGVDFHTRGKRTDEMIEVLRKLWGGEGRWVSHQGRFFQFPEIEIVPAPSRPVPIYCGGTSAPALRRAATLCDGYIGPGHTAEEVPGVLAHLQRLRAEAGRDHLPFETILPIKPMSPPPSAGTFKRLEELGMTATFAAPFDAGALDRRSTRVRLGRTSTLDEKKQLMEHYAINVIHKM